MDDEFSFFEKLYFHELERKQQLESNTSLPAGVIAGNFGLLGYFFTHFRFGGKEYSLSNYVESAFLIGSFVTFVLLCFATYWCIRAVTGSAYDYLPGAKTMYDYFEDLDMWYTKNKTREANKTARKEFRTFLLGALTKCSQKNWLTNLVRSEELFSTKRFTVFALTTLAISAVCYYIDFWFDFSTLTNT
jgi:hypothetical protein